MQPSEIWDLTIATPIGKVNAVIDLYERDGAWHGTAQGAGEDIELRDLLRDGDRITWRQAVTKPMRLNLAFDMTVDGDAMTGTSKAGRLPSSKVTGRRRR
ncbi:hypothetical protein [Nocardia sp. NPDC005998]|uniref:hypothetical protein n=1 Tax=Nocardia sp. NPDC005998 TaxID=3156894 RepID=UPI0033B3B157